MIGVIGGSGLYDIQGLEKTQEITISTPFGEPSSTVMTGELAGKKVAFLARHGAGHLINPSEVNYRANIYALKSLGVSQVIGISACGSLREDYAPGSIVIPSQLVDFTKGRKRSFFEGGVVAHVGVPDPFCSHIMARLVKAGKAANGTIHDSGTYITVEGPRFSTRGESDLFRSWGMSIIGMTTSPEAFLAREAEMCYAVLAHVTDYDVWHEEPVSIEIVTQAMEQNIRLANEMVKAFVDSAPDEYACQHQDALKDALLSNMNKAPKEALNRLDLLIHKYRTS
jgi:5'-methylthioadenosine phosphorylase